MSPTAYLKDGLADDRTTIECETVEFRGSVVWLEPAEGEDRLVVPMDNLAGVEGGDVDQEVDQIPTQGGQYSEVVTRISE